MIKAFIFVAVFLLIPIKSFGQDYDSRWEVFGTVGYGGTWDDEGGIGGGIVVGGGLGVRPTSRVGFEGSFLRVFHKRTFDLSPVIFEGTGVFVSGNALYHFSESRVQPYVTGGAGLVHHTDRSSGLGQPRSSVGASGLAYNFGAGLRIFANRHISLRPEFKVYLGNLGDRAPIDPVFNAVGGSLGISYHW
jgi:hypothetical protein